MSSIFEQLLRPLLARLVIRDVARTNDAHNHTRRKKTSHLCLSSTYTLYIYIYSVSLDIGWLYTMLCGDERAGDNNIRDPRSAEGATEPN